MLSPFRIHRLSNTLRGFEAIHIERVWAAISEARRMLADHPCPDTFLGRRTYEPFPAEKHRESHGELAKRQLTKINSSTNLR